MCVCFEWHKNNWKKVYRRLFKLFFFDKIGKALKKKVTNEEIIWKKVNRCFTPEKRDWGKNVSGEKRPRTFGSKKRLANNWELHSVSLINKGDSIFDYCQFPIVSSLKIKSNLNVKCEELTSSRCPTAEQTKAWWKKREDHSQMELFKKFLSSDELCT